MISIRRKVFFFRGKPFEMRGIRVANALENDACAKKLIDCMDSYLSYGVNTMSVFLTGAMHGNANPFECDGNFHAKLRGSDAFAGRGNTPSFRFDNSYLDRLAGIVEAAGGKGMAVQVGLFYQVRINCFRDDEAIRNAARQAAMWLKEKAYDNILMDLVNEYGHPGFKDRPICRGIAYTGSEDGGEVLLNDFKQICPDIPASISGCGVDVEGVKKSYYNFKNQDFVLIHYRLSPNEIRSAIGRDIPVVLNEWGPGVALEPRGHYGQWIHQDRKEWETTLRLMVEEEAYPFIFSHWKQNVLDGVAHFETGPAGAQPNDFRGGVPSDEWMFGLIRDVKRGK